MRIYRCLRLFVLPILLLFALVVTAQETVSGGESGTGASDAGNQSGGAKPTNVSARGILFQPQLMFSSRIIYGKSAGAVRYYYLIGLTGDKKKAALYLGYAPGSEEAGVEITAETDSRETAAMPVKPDSATGPEDGESTESTNVGARGLAYSMQQRFHLGGPVTYYIGETPCRKPAEIVAAGYVGWYQVNVVLQPRSLDAYFSGTNMAAFAREQENLGREGVQIVYSMLGGERFVPVAMSRDRQEGSGKSRQKGQTE